MIGEPMIDYRLEHVFSYAGRLARPPAITAPVADGAGVNFCYSGGELAGPRLRGILRPGGGDWAILRKDGVGRLDVRRTIEAQDGVSLMAAYQGVIDIGEEGVHRLHQGTPPPVAQLRFALRFVTDHPEYRWLERLTCFGIGEYRAMDNAVRYDVYAVHHGRRRAVRSRQDMTSLSDHRERLI
jgi:hypothetical protein